MLFFEFVELFEIFDIELLFFSFILIFRFILFPFFLFDVFVAELNRELFLELEKDLFLFIYILSIELFSILFFSLFTFNITSMPISSLSFNFNFCLIFFSSIHFLYLIYSLIVSDNKIFISLFNISNDLKDKKYSEINIKFLFIFPIIIFLL